MTKPQVHKKQEKRFKGLKNIYSKKGKGHSDPLTMEPEKRKPKSKTLLNLQRIKEQIGPTSDPTPLKNNDKSRSNNGKGTKNVKCNFDLLATETNQRKHQSKTLIDPKTIKEQQRPLSDLLPAEKKNDKPEPNKRKEPIIVEVDGDPSTTVPSQRKHLVMSLSKLQSTKDISKQSSNSIPISKEHTYKSHVGRKFNNAKGNLTSPITVPNQGNPKEMSANDSTSIRKQRKQSSNPKPFKRKNEFKSKVRKSYRKAIVVSNLKQPQFKPAIRLDRIREQLRRYSVDGGGSISKSKSMDKKFVQRKIEDGIRQAAKGKYYTAKQSFLEALKEINDVDFKAQIYLSIANGSVAQRFDEITLEKERVHLGMEAVSYYQKAIAIMSGNNNKEVLNVRAALGNVLYSMQDYSAASDQYAQAADNMSTIDTVVLAPMLYNYAIIKFREKEYKLTQSLLRKALEYKASDKDPIFFIPQYDISYYLGMSFFRSGNYDKAVGALTRFLAESKEASDSVLYDVGEVHLSLAVIYERGGNKHHDDLALKHYVEHLDCKDPKLTILLQSDNHMQRNRNKDTHLRYLEAHLLDVFASIGHLYMKAEHFTIAGNCFREAYYGAKLISEKEDLPYSLLGQARKAYECYTAANNNLHRKMMLQEIISILEQIEDCDQPDADHLSNEQIADYYQGLAQLYNGSGEINLALRSYLQCLEIRERYLMQADSRLAKLRCKIASYLYKLEEYNKGLKYCDMIYQHSNDYKITKKALCIKGKICARKLDKENCVLAFQEAIELEKELGRQHSSGLSEIYEYFGQACFELECFEESVDCFQQAYKIRAMSSETKPGECLALIQGMVDAYKIMKKYELALLACKKILWTQKEINISHSRDEACTMEIMGDLHASIGEKSDYFNAVELYRLSAKIMRKIHGSSNGSVLMIYVKMANILGLRLNEHEKALQLFRFVMKRNLNGEDDSSHVFTLKALEGQGDMKSLQSQYKSALRKYESVMQYIDKGTSNKVWKDKYEDLIRDTRIGIFYKIGKMYRSMKKYDTALQTFGKGLEEIKLQLNRSLECSDDTITSRLFYEIGLVHLELKDSETALEKFIKASEIIENIPELDSDGQILYVDIERQLEVLEKKSFFSFAFCKS